MDDVTVKRGDGVECFGQEGGKIVVRAVYANRAPGGSLFPWIARIGCGIDGPADVKGQIDSEPEYGRTTIRGLASSFTRLGSGARG